jgi:uncharacterized membrane protein YkvI
MSFIDYTYLDLHPIYGWIGLIILISVLYLLRKVVNSIDIPRNKVKRDKK